MPSELKFKLNGKETAVSSDTGRSLLEVLREDFRLTGTKYGCGEGGVRRVHGAHRRQADVFMHDDGVGGIAAKKSRRSKASPKEKNFTPCSRPFVMQWPTSAATARPG